MKTKKIRRATRLPAKRRSLAKQQRTPTRESWKLLTLARRVKVLERTVENLERALEEKLDDVRAEIRQQGTHDPNW